MDISVLCWKGFSSLQSAPENLQLLLAALDRLAENGLLWPTLREAHRDIED